ncbi:M60 family peptidase N-terminal accessory domain-containing protein [Pedobacter jeongneungensis]|uniref:M60 family peptidase N-terminal accessory domain-containing protein n=1 Tax=Pedobacter jeongneungensis TaxID=947309 RepID=A0ABP8B655_9SPHI
MKFNQLTKIFGLSLLVAFTACKKYGYEVPDGYPDDSQNIADGTIDTNMKLIDKSMYAKARVFPGLVDQSEPRVKDAQFTLDLNFTDQTAQNLRISVAPSPQYSTGYYAAPGELIKLVVPAGIDGLTVQIGAHTDNLAGKSPLLRDPVIYNRKKLVSGVNYIRNLYGGHIYILATFAYASPVTFSITGACASPDFILGQSTDTEWINRVKASSVPWLELRTKRVIFTIPRDKVLATFNSAEPFTNPTLAMTKWNDVFDLDYNAWMGLSDNAPDIRDRSPQSQWRGVLDIQLTNGYGHNGFPFVGTNDSEWFRSFTSVKSLNTSEGQWGSYHEFGHNCQQGSVWSWSTLGETTNNLFSFKVANRIGANYNILHPAVSSGFPKAIAYATAVGTKNFDTDAAMNAVDEAPFMKMTPFVQIFELYGYGAMTYLYKEARHADRLNTNDITKHNFVYEKLSDYTKIDLAPFFDAWGILISDAVIAKVSAKYPMLNKAIWTYNPLNKTGGTAAYDPTRVISVSSLQSTTSDLGSNLIDGNTATFWHSKYSPAPTAAETFPFTVIIGTGTRTAIPVKGITFNQRTSNNNGYIKDVEIFASNDNVSYTSVGTTTVPQNANKYDFNFPGGSVNTKFIKVLIKTGASTVFCSLAECNLIKP